MNAAIDAFLMALVRHSLAASVLVLLVLATQWIFRRQLSPHWRCALWLLVVVRLLPLSLSSSASVFNLLPRWDAPSRHDATSPSIAPAPIPSAPAATSTAVPPGVASLPVPAEAESTPAARVSWLARWTWPLALFCAWLAGALLLGSYVAVAAFAFARDVARLRPLEDDQLLAVLRDCTRRMGLRRTPVVVTCGAVRTPALHGFFRPRLLLPMGFAREFSAAEQRHIFLHELAHLRRRDLLLNWLMTALQIVHWFNPLVWLAFARWRTDREIACDAAALEIAGPSSGRAYGETMLKLLENLSAVPPRAGLVGILEGRRQLRTRLQMIATFTPARRPMAGIAMLGLLAAVGLTDAQVTPASRGAQRLPAHQVPDAPYVLFLVNGSESMRAAAWQRTVSTVEAQLNALPRDAAFHVWLFHGNSVEDAGTRRRSGDLQAIPDTLQRLRAFVPTGGNNLESTFTAMRSLLGTTIPERIMLVTDSLPTVGTTPPSAHDDVQAQRVALFNAAIKTLPPRLPVHTLLLPSSTDEIAATAGMYWQLANATRGGLTCPVEAGVAARTHLAFVIDTSGSMRDPNTGRLWPGVLNTIDVALDAHPALVGLQLLDGDGRFILGRRGQGAAGWLPSTPATREQIKQVLATYAQDTVSNPVPGVKNAIRFLQDKHAPDFRMGIYLLGDEFNSRDPAAFVLDQIEAVNPRTASGRRAVTIDAIGFPTTVRSQFSMGNTGLRFADLMRRLTQAHDGAFVALPDL